MSFQKQKGNAFEKKVAQTLKDITGANWTRTPYSGAFLGRKNASRANNLDDSQVAMLKGDIANPEGYQFIIECKSHADFSFSAMLQDGFAKLDNWINEAFVDSNKGKLPYALCFNITRNGDYICFDIDQFPELKSIPDIRVYPDPDNTKEYYYVNIVFYYNVMLGKRYAIFPLYELANSEIWDLIEPKIKKR